MKLYTRSVAAIAAAHLRVAAAIARSAADLLDATADRTMRAVIR